MGTLRGFPSLERVTAARRRLEAETPTAESSPRPDIGRFAGRLAMLPEIEAAGYENRTTAEPESPPSKPIR